ncbi:MAG TPA: hypothetical protein VFR37_14375, partial [Longimicrobium sp.]|nr:hypothetical protein [Longimicrobium sp.]
MMRRVWRMAAAVALAACGTAGGDDARPAEPAARTAAGARVDSAAAEGEARVDLVAVGRFQLVLHRRESGVVDSVFVIRAGRRVQTLVPSELEEHILLDDPTYRIDLDFDGHTDFGLVTLVPASPNPAYDYWRFDPAADRFRYVGNYPMFDPDSTTRTLYSHSRDGHAGRLRTNVRWGWIGGTLVEVGAFQTTYLDDVQRYADVVYER